jgi:hypothetical protein
MNSTLKRKYFVPLNSVENIGAAILILKLKKGHGNKTKIENYSKTYSKTAVRRNGLQ